MKNNVKKFFDKLLLDLIQKEDLWIRLENDNVYNLSVYSNDQISRTENHNLHIENSHKLINDIEDYTTGKVSYPPKVMCESYDFDLKIADNLIECSLNQDELSIVYNSFLHRISITNLAKSIKDMEKLEDSNRMILSLMNVPINQNLYYKKEDKRSALFKNTLKLLTNSLQNPNKDELLNALDNFLLRYKEILKEDSTQFNHNAQQNLMLI